METIIGELDTVLKATEKAKEDDPNGKGRKKIAEYVGISDDEKVSLMLRILEKEEIVGKIAIEKVSAIINEIDEL